MARGVRAAFRHEQIHADGVGDSSGKGNVANQGARHMVDALERRRAEIGAACIASIGARITQGLNDGLQDHGRAGDVPQPRLINTKPMVRGELQGN